MRNLSMDHSDDELDQHESELRAAKAHGFFDFSDSDNDGQVESTCHVSSVSVDPKSEELVQDPSQDCLFVLASTACSETAIDLRGCYVALKFQGVDCESQIDFVMQFASDIVARSYQNKRMFAKHRRCSHEGEEDQLKFDVFLAWGAHGEKWSFLAAGSGRWLAEAMDLEGPWVVRTTVAEESELGMSVVRESHLNTRKLDLQNATCTNPSRVKSIRWTFSTRVICVPERVENAYKIQRQLSELCIDSGLCVVDTQIFDAWDTRDLSPEDLHAAGFVGPQRWREGHKLLGCALSHSELWAELLEDGSLAGNAGAMMVLEDDVVLNSARPFSTMLEAIFEQVQDYDFVLLGARAEEAWNGFCKHNFPASWTSDQLVRILYFMGFWGYLVTPRGARRALRTLWGTSRDPKPLDGDCDVLIASACLFRELDIAVCIPNLVLHPSLQNQFGYRDRMIIEHVNYEYRVELADDAIMGGTTGDSVRRSGLGFAHFLDREVPTQEIELALKRFRRLADSTEASCTIPFIVN